MCVLKDHLGPVGPSAEFVPDNPRDGDGEEDDDDERSPMLPPSPLALPLALPLMRGEPETPMWKHDALMDHLVANFNSRLDQQIESCADDIVEKVTLRIEAKLKIRNFGNDMADGSAGGKPDPNTSPRDSEGPVIPKQDSKLEAEEDENPPPATMSLRSTSHQ